MRMAILWIGQLLALGFGLGVLGGFAGALHPMGDSLAVFRMWLALGLLGSGVVLLAVSARVWATLAMGLGAFALVPIWLGWLAPPSPEEALILYQKNLLYALDDPAPIRAELRQVDPDFVTFQEVSTANEAAIFDTLPEDYARLLCPFAAVGGVAVASRFPEVEGQSLCIEGLGLAAMQVEAPGGPVWLVSIHLHWPWPHGQADQLDQILPVLEGLEGPVLIGGDFNMVPWSHALGQVMRASGSAVLGPTQGTRALIEEWVDLPIDHVLAPEGGQVTYRPQFGSDHAGLLARVGLPGQ